MQTPSSSRVHPRVYLLLRPRSRPSYVKKKRNVQGQHSSFSDPGENEPGTCKICMDWILENTLTSFCPPQSAMPYHQAATLNNLKPSQARLFRCFSTSSRVGFSMCGMCNGGPMASFTCTRLGSKGRTGKPQGNTAGIESPFSHQRNFQAPWGLLNLGCF